MAGDLNVKAEIEYVLKDQGITAAVGKVKELEGAQRRVTEETKKATEASTAFGGALRSIGAYAASFLAAGSIISFLRSSQREFIEAEKASVRLQLSLKLLGDEFASSFDDVSAYADEMERLTGVDADVIRSAQSVLVTIGRLSGETLNRATRAALDLSVALGTDLNNAAMIIAKAGAGAEGALGRMGIRIDETVPPSERLKAILTALEDRMGGVAEAMGDTIPGAAQKAATAFDNMSESAGRLFTTTEGIGLWTAALLKMKSALDGLKEFSDSYSDWFVALFGFGAGSGTPFKGIGSAPRDEAASFKPDAEVNVSLKDADEAAKKREELEAKAREKREEEERKLEERIAARRDEIFKAQLDRELAANSKAIDDRAKQEEFYQSSLASVSDEIDRRKAVADQVLEIGINAAREEIAFKEASLEEWLAFEKNAIDLTVTNEKIANAKKLALDEEYARKKMALAQMTADAELAAQQQVFGAVGNLLGTVFEGNKAFAIAQAIINTAEGVTQAMTLPPPYDVIKAAVVVATGIAQVAKIRSTNLGSGGSVGGSPSSGKNFARSVGGGAQTGPAAAPPTTQSGATASSMTIDQRRLGTTVIINGTLVGGRAGVAELKRMLDQEDRAQRSRLVR